MSSFYIILHQKNKKNPKSRAYLISGAQGRNRTGTVITNHRILSPVRLPISPLEQWYPVRDLNA